jgi:NAD(P)-dependent dehydrogenase (short-subunit alcohol dehydrogenase family)
MADSRDEKLAIVTGGGSGIGKAQCQELARRGAAVAVADISFADASRVAEAIGGPGGPAEARRAEVTAEDAVRQMAEETAVGSGRLDHLFNNAGTGIGCDARDLTAGHWRRVWADTNQSFPVN